MGSPVSAVIAEIVMQEIESIAISTSPVPVRWWRRYVDDSNSCLRRNDIEQFHAYLNTINKNIQFTIEVPSTSERGETISFLDTRITILANRTLEVSVYRKATHTNKYLSYHSHNPTQSKRAVVKTLLDRADNIPSTDVKKQQERDRVIQELMLNGYPRKFLNQVSRPSPNDSISNSNNEPKTKGFSCIPYMKGVSEQIKQILKNVGVRTVYKPMISLGEIFGKPKDKQKTTEVKGIVYKFECPDCSFKYVGESKRSWKSRWAEHKPGVRPDIKSAIYIKDHAESTGQSSSIDNAKILEKRIHNIDKRTFLESFHSILDNKTVNEHKEFPHIYTSLVQSCNRNDDI